MKLAIIDLDGVVANNDARMSIARDSCAGLTGKAWSDAFWGTLFKPELVELDEPIPGAKEALCALEYAGFTVNFLTSRPETMRIATEIWLEKHGLFGLPDSAPFRTVYMKDFETDRYTRTDEWKAHQVHKLVSVVMPDVLLFIDNEIKNRMMVQGLKRFDVLTWFLTDSLTSDLVIALVDALTAGSKE